MLVGSSSQVRGEAGRKRGSKRWVQETGLNLFSLWLGMWVLSRQLENDERRGDEMQRRCNVLCSSCVL